MAYDKIVLDIIKTVEDNRDKIYDFLIFNGVFPKSKSLESLITDVVNLRVINKGKKYISVNTDRNGYVIGHYSTDDIINIQDLPKDFTKGYYKITEEGEIELDELQRLKLMEV